MDATDHEHPRTTDTVPTMRKEPPPDSPAAGEGATFSSESTSSESTSSESTDDVDPTYESGYGFGV
jgi:hypothetical protein